MSTDHHRRIDLQSPADLTYLHTNIQRAATEKLDLAFPPRAAPEGEEDALRQKVEALVQEYITHTLTLALPSLTVNGLDASPSLLNPHPPTTNTASNTTSASDNPAQPPQDTTRYDDYNPTLAAKLRSLYATLEHESTRVAELRRSAPGAAARAYIERVEAEREAERRRGEETRREVEEGCGGEDDETMGMGMGRLERREEVERMWGKAVEGLVGLEGVTEVVARLERAGKAVEAVEGM